MSKWKWIAQDLNGDIYKLDIEPKIYDWGFLNVHNRGLKLIEEGKPNPNFKDTLTNLETEDYEINDGILTRIPRKTELDKLIANIKKIDKKAAKYINKNRHKLDDVENLYCCFAWDNYPKHDWRDIYEKLEEMAEQEPAKETLKYRVALCLSNNQPYIMISYDRPENERFELNNKYFVRWLTDWIEVEV